MKYYDIQCYILFSLTYAYALWCVFYVPVFCDTMSEIESNNVFGFCFLKTLVW